MSTNIHSKSNRCRIDYDINSHLTEEIWQNISSHLSAKEWAKAAGTCKTSYIMSLKWARLGQDTPHEG